MPGYNKRNPTYKSRSKRSFVRRYGKAAAPAARTLQAAVRRAVAKSVNKNIETKQANYTSTDGAECFHNNCVNLISPGLLATTQGVTDPTTDASACRIGDRINLRGVKLRLMMELNERYSNVTCRLLVIKHAKGDPITRATLFNGLSGNKMLDTLNTERYTVLLSKYFKIKADNNGTDAATVVSGSGLYGNTPVYSRATKIVKCWIPGTKFSKSGIIMYENASSQTKFFDYSVVVYCYSNYSVLQDVYYVARVNDFNFTMYYKDA